MDTKAYQRVAKSKYIRALRTIVSGKILANKIEPSLPKGWDVNVNLLLNNLEIYKCEPVEGKTDSHEFKFVCKIVEAAFGEKIVDRYGIALGDKTVTSLHASGYFKVDRRYMGVEICLMNPENMPDCEVTFKRTWKKEAVVSDNCLGLGK